MRTHIVIFLNKLVFNTENGENSMGGRYDQSHRHAKPDGRTPRTRPTSRGRQPSPPGRTRTSPLGHRLAGCSWGGLGQEANRASVRAEGAEFHGAEAGEGALGRDLDRLVEVLAVQHVVTDRERAARPSLFLKATAVAD